MSPTTIADPSLIPDIEAFEERVAIHIHEGGIPTDQAKDLAAQAQGLPIRLTGLGSKLTSTGRGWGRSISLNQTNSCSASSLRAVGRG